MKALVLSLLCFVASAAAGATDFDAGNKTYDEGKFLEARQHYEAAVSRGEWTANLFYNLGNADERVGATGLAILNYERALALQPGHSEARANLEFLRQKSGSRVPDNTWQTKALGALPFDRWLIAASVFGWLTVFVLVVPFARRTRLGAAGVFGFVITLSAAAFSGWAAWKTSGEVDAAVVIARQADARQGPADRAPIADALPAGSRVRVLSVRDDWSYCELPDGNTGWVPTSSIERIRLASS